MRESVVENIVQRGMLVGARRKVLIAPGDGYFVPLADASGVRVRKIGHAIGG